MTQPAATSNLVTQTQANPSSEATEAGEQMLTAGIRPITTRDRLTILAMRPMAPKRNPNANQKPWDLGLFDDVRINQIDLIDFLKSNPSTPTNT